MYFLLQSSNAKWRTDFVVDGCCCGKIWRWLLGFWLASCGIQGDYGEQGKKQQDCDKAMLWLWPMRGSSDITRRCPVRWITPRCWEGQKPRSQLWLMDCVWQASRTCRRRRPRLECGLMPAAALRSPAPTALLTSWSTWSSRGPRDGACGSWRRR